MTAPVPTAPVPTPGDIAPQVPAPVEPATPTTPATPPAPTAPTPGATPTTEYPDGLGDPGKKALDAEREARATAEKALKEFQDKAAADAKKIADEKLSELERAQNLAAEKAEAATKLERENLRLNFAYQNGVPKEWVHRIQGTTPEELAADWAILQPTLAAPVAPVDPNAPRVPAPVPSQGPQPGQPQTADDLIYGEFYNASQNRK